MDSIPDGGTDKHPWNDEDVETAYQNGFKAGAEWRDIHIPKLPDNIDEAAELSANGAMISRQAAMYNTVVYNTGIKCFDHSDLMKQFKAGAKWMAEQGYTKEAVIGIATEEISINVSEQTLNELDLRPGDKVIVQIRKV